MNRLTNWLAKGTVCPVAAMNQLQEHGLISDNAVYPADVADCDGLWAVAWLISNSTVCPAPSLPI